MESFNLLLVVASLLLAAALRPWRLLAGSELLTPLLAALVITPWLWALPWLHDMPFRLQMSGACLIALTLGWPLAVPVLCAVAVIAGWLAGADWVQQLDMAVWLGIVPATLSVLLGLVLRRWVWKNLFVYILGRGFLGTVLCLFVTGWLAQRTGHSLQGTVEPGLALVARWLMAWSDGFMTGMVVAICVAFKPRWLATWSDQLYIPPPPRQS